jgi:hypothetical protein
VSKSDASPADNAPQELDAKIQALEAEILDLKQQKLCSEQEAKRLLAAEDARANVSFPKEIFTQQQNKLRLDVEVQLRRNKINRLKLAADPTLFF